MSKGFDLIFTAIDVNKDRCISIEEFLMAFKAYGHDDEAKSGASFAAYNPKDGLIPFSDIIDAWIEFVTGTDESKVNIVKAGLRRMTLNNFSRG